MEIVIKQNGKIIAEFDCQRTATAWCKDFIRNRSVTSKSFMAIEKWIGPRGHYQEWEIV